MPTIDIDRGSGRREVAEVIGKVPRSEGGGAEEVLVGGGAAGAYGPSEPYAPLPGWNNRVCICAVVLSVLGM